MEDLQSLWESHQSQEQPESPSRLPVESLSLRPELYQSRSGYEYDTGIVNSHHVAGLMAALKGSKNSDLDPIKILKVKDENIVVDGHHRLKAYKGAGRKDIPVEFISGGPKAALLIAGAENKKTRLPMSTAERSERAWTLVLADSYSKQQIMDGSGASNGTVAAMRRKWKALREAGEEIPDSWREANGRGLEWDPEMGREMARKWAKAITGAVGAPASFTNNKVSLLGEALIEWSPRLAENIAIYLIQELGLIDQVEIMAEEKRRDEEEFPCEF